MLKFFLYAIVRIFLWTEFQVLKLVPARKKNGILVMRLDAIGDSIIGLDSMKEYKKHFPNKHLVLLCNAAWAEIAVRLPYFDEVICLDRKKFERKILYRQKILFRLKRRTFEQVINPVFSRDFFVQDVLLHHLRAKEKVGYHGDYNNTANTLRGFGIRSEKHTQRLQKKANRWFSTLIKADPQPLMELSRNADFIRKFLDPNFQSRLPEFPFPIPLFANLPKENYMVLFVGASTPRKYWKKENYECLIPQLSISTIVLCGGKQEINLGHELVQSLSNCDKKICNFIGKTSLLDLFSIIQHAQYIITNDTSASHITVALRTPSVCLMGGAHFGRFQPYSVEHLNDNEKKYLPKIVFNKMDCYGCNNNCSLIHDKKTIFPCIESITVEQVLEKVWEIERD